MVVAGDRLCLLSVSVLQAYFISSVISEFCEDWREHGLLAWLLGVVKISSWKLATGSSWQFNFRWTGCGSVKRTSLLIACISHILYFLIWTNYVPLNWNRLLHSGESYTFRKLEWAKKSEPWCFITNFAKIFANKSLFCQIRVSNVKHVYYTRIYYFRLLLNILLLKYSMYDVMLDAKLSWYTNEISIENKILIENLRIENE